MVILVSENQNTLNSSQPSTFSSHMPQSHVCPALYISSLTMSGQDHHVLLTSPVQVMVNWYCAYGSIPMRRCGTNISEVNIMDHNFLYFKCLRQPRGTHILCELLKFRGKDTQLRSPSQFNIGTEEKALAQILLQPSERSYCTANILILPKLN